MRRRQGLLRMWHDTSGSALLEGTIVTPFLCILVFGVLEFSRYFYQQHLVSTGVRDAARYLARTSDPTAGGAQTTAQNLAATGSPTGGTARRTAGFDPADVSISFSLVDNSIDGATGLRPYRQMTSECGGPDQVRLINVTGSFTFAPLGFWGFFGFSAPTITVAHTERCIGPG